MERIGNLTFQKAVVLVVLFFIGFCPVDARADVYVNHLYVSLSWQPNSESDIQGYEIHRSNFYSGPYAQVNAALINGTSWTDTNVTDGSTYYYKLRAVDLCGNVGAFSAPSDAIIIKITDDEVTITSGPTGTPNPVGLGGTVNCSVTATDSSGHNLTYQWNATSGTFDGGTTRNPVWHAPDKISGVAAEHEISVIITCSQGKWVGGSYSQRVSAADNKPPIAEAGNNQHIRGSTLVSLNGCSSYDPDNSPSPLAYHWEQTAGKNSVQLSNADTCNPSFISPDSSGPLTFTLTVSDGATTAQDTVKVTVDSRAPQLLSEELGPYAQQGLDGSIGAESDTCIRARLLDDMDINFASQTCRTLITAYGIYTDGKVERSEQLIGQIGFQETEPGLAWIMFVPDYKTTYGSGLPYGFTVGVDIEACDSAGNSMEPCRYRFKVRDSAARLPDQVRSRDPHPSQPGDVLSVTLEEGQMQNTRLEYSDTVPVPPYFGPTNELPPHLNGHETNSLVLNLQPTMNFQNPVKLFIPLPGENNLKNFRVYRYDPNPAIGWQEGVVGDGWLEYREEHQTFNPPTIELWINHFTGLHLEATDTGTSGGSSGIEGCFIATAAYGSANAGEVLIFRQFRDKYMLTNLPGRIFVRLYYRFSPPTARFISKHEHVRTVVRYGLSPMASTCEFVLTSPCTAKGILAAALAVAALGCGLTLIIRRRESKP